MSEIDVKSLFDESRQSQGKVHFRSYRLLILRFPIGWKLLSLLLYSPIGLILLLIRVLISLQLWLIACLLPDCEALRLLLNHGFSLVFGIMVRTENKPSNSESKEPHIIIANKVSALDQFAIHRVSKSLSPIVWNVPSALSNALGLHPMDTSGKEVFIGNIQTFLASSRCNVTLQPEYAATNGKVGLLKFNSWPFMIQPEVHPVAIRASRPFVDVSLTSLTSTWWADVLWFMFVPWTVFTLKYLPVKRNADSEALTREVEADIASALNLKTTNYTTVDKREYEKRYLAEKMRSRNVVQQRSSGASVEVQWMATQVSEVLPMVPRNVIIRDLLQTRNVDVTIANILDGAVTYMPEPVTMIPSAETSRRRQVLTSANKTTPGILTFQQRKAMMIAEAREKYIKKHGLKNC